ncbi:MAG: VanZ family protein [Prevotellaceae bacterium]|nr:VanZ family protein [Prevotellaceae bacterium]
MQIISLVGIAYVPIAFLMRKKLSPPRRMANFMVLSWMIVVLYVTVFGSVVWGVTVFRPGNIPVNLNPVPMIMEWSKHSGRIAGQLLENMIMFMPVGFLTPVALKSGRKVGRAFCYILLFTLVIEVAQYLLGTRAADMSDIIMNTFGGMAGYAIFRAFDFILKNNSLWKSFCDSDARPYPTRPQKAMSTGKAAAAYSVIFALAISSGAFFTHLLDFQTASYSQISAGDEEQSEERHSYNVPYQIESEHGYDTGTYQPTEEDIQIDQELQENRERNIELNRQMWKDAEARGITLPEDAMHSGGPVDIAGYPIERPFFDESRLRPIFEAYEDYLLTGPDYLEPYDANKYVAAGRSLDPRINALLYDPDVDRANGILKDYQSENLYAKEALKKTGEYTTIVLGKVSTNDKWEVIFEGSYYELRAKAM